MALPDGCAPIPYDVKITILLTAAAKASVIAKVGSLLLPNSCGNNKAVSRVTK